VLRTGELESWMGWGYRPMRREFESPPWRRLRLTFSENTILGVADIRLLTTGEDPENLASFDAA